MLCMHVCVCVFVYVCVYIYICQFLTRYALMHSAQRTHYTHTHARKHACIYTWTCEAQHTHTHMRRQQRCSAHSRCLIQTKITGVKQYPTTASTF